jgi:hypothetical protein
MYFTILSMFLQQKFVFMKFLKKIDIAYISSLLLLH